MVVRSECRRTESERERLLTVKRYRANERITANAFATDSKQIAWQIGFEISKVWGKRAERSGERRRVARRDEKNEIEDAQRCTKIRNP